MAEIFRKLGFKNKPVKSLFNAVWSSVDAFVPEEHVSIIDSATQSFFEDAYGGDDFMFQSENSDEAVSALCTLVSNLDFDKKTLPTIIAEGLHSAAKAVNARKRSMGRTSPEPSNPRTTKSDRPVKNVPLCCVCLKEVCSCNDVPAAPRPKRTATAKCPTCGSQGQCTCAQDAAAAVKRKQATTKRKQAPPPPSEPSDPSDSDSDDDEEDEENEEEVEEFSEVESSNVATKSTYNELSLHDPAILLNPKVWKNLAATRNIGPMVLAQRLSEYYDSVTRSKKHDESFLHALVVHTVTAMLLSSGEALGQLVKIADRILVRYEFFRTQNLLGASAAAAGEEELLNYTLPKALQKARRAAEKRAIATAKLKPVRRNEDRGGDRRGADRGGRGGDRRGGRGADRGGRGTGADVQQGIAVEKG